MGADYHIDQVRECAENIGAPMVVLYSFYHNGILHHSASFYMYQKEGAANDYMEDEEIRRNVQEGFENLLSPINQ